MTFMVSFSVPLGGKPAHRRLIVFVENVVLTASWIFTGNALA